MSGEISTLVREVATEAFHNTPANDGGIVIPVRLDTPADNEVFIELILAVASVPTLGDLLEKRMIRFCAKGNGAGGQSQAKPANAPTQPAPAPAEPQVQVVTTEARVITERLVKQNEGNTLEVPAKAVITPLARELARRLGVDIRKATS
jgi:pyruvate/2-oxoglutarate dehydrogenase complex dihydrolipoamide acyltransferase (E2) component